MNKPNIVLDFSKTQGPEGQELAIMPAGLAERLLRSHVAMLKTVSADHIISMQMEELNRVGLSENLDKFIQAHIEFVQERQLIDNISNERWDAYKVGE